MRRRLHRIRKALIRFFAIIDRPAAWVLMLGGGATFIGVITGLIATGNFKAVTLLVAADLVVSGFSTVQEAENEEKDDAASDVREGGRNEADFQAGNRGTRLQ